MNRPTLLWLQIHRYEQFEPVRIEFSERENLILGINGAGKSRLLKLLRAVLNLDFSEVQELSEVQDQPFDVEFELRTAVSFDRPARVLGRVQVERVGRGDQGSDVMAASSTVVTGTLKIQPEQLGGLSVTFTPRTVVIAAAEHQQDTLPYNGDGRLFQAFFRAGESSGWSSFYYPTCGAPYVREDARDFEAMTQDVEFTASRGAVQMAWRRYGTLLAGDLSRLLLLVFDKWDQDAHVVSLDSLVRSAPPDLQLA